MSNEMDGIDPQPRMKAIERRELILDAAMGVFGDFGYVGATTDQVARAAGVSQPYVVRMFVSKELLFIEVLNRALARLHGAFRAVLSNRDDDLHHRLGRAYVDLVSDRGLLLCLMHAFVLGSDRAIGSASRAGFLSVFRLLRDEAGFSAEEAHAFLAQGMLINTLVGLRMSEEFDTVPDARELLIAAVPEKLDVLLALGEQQRTEER